MCILLHLYSKDKYPKPLMLYLAYLEVNRHMLSGDKFIRALHALEHISFTILNIMFLNTKSEVTNRFPAGTLLPARASKACSKNRKMRSLLQLGQLMKQCMQYKA